jgi:hypothetical protein
MRGIEIGLVTAIAVSLGTGGFLLVSNREQAARMDALERELAILREKNAKDGGGVPAPAEARPVADLPAATGVAASDLADQVAALSTTVKKLEQTAETLDSRITRSRLAVPSDEERQAQIARAHARLEELRKTAEEAREKARQVATSLKVPFDEKRLLETGANATLEEKPEFVQARNAAAAKARVVEIFEKKLAELQFSTVVEALPPDAER